MQLIQLRQIKKSYQDAKGYYGAEKIRAETKESRRVGIKSKIIAENSKHGGEWKTEKELKLSPLTWSPIHKKWKHCLLSEIS